MVFRAAFQAQLHTTLVVAVVLHTVAAGRKAPEGSAVARTAKRREAPPMLEPRILAVVEAGT